MTPETAATKLFEAITAACNANTIGIPVARISWPNVSFQQPKGQVWARVTIRHDQDNPKSVSLGAPSEKRYTYGAALIVQVFQPTGTPAANVALQRAWEFVTVLQSKRYGTGRELLTQGAAVREADNLEAEWYQVNVTVPFTYEHIA